MVILPLPSLVMDRKEKMSTNENKEILLRVTTRIEILQSGFDSLNEYSKLHLEELIAKREELSARNAEEILKTYEAEVATRKGEAVESDSSDES